MKVKEMAINMKEKLTSDPALGQTIRRTNGNTMTGVRLKESHR